MITAPLRKPYQGVIQIFQFNWRFYLGTTISVALVMLVLPHLPPLGRIALLIGLTPAIFWMASSLLVSHYIYDRSSLYDLRWISQNLALQPDTWLNIHCGLDETSLLLKDIFPQSAGQIVDIYDQNVMTESSIHMARLLQHSAVNNLRGRYDALPLNKASVDAAFLFFAAHELRFHRQRVKLFQEVARILTPGGDLVLMEHSRDGWNFLAFGPGFLHFFSPREWRTAAAEAGLVLRSEFARTPFIHVYHLRRS